MSEKSIVIAGRDYVIGYDFKITVHGNNGTPPSLSYPGDPPEPPEFEVDIVDLREDLSGKLGPSLEIPKWLERQFETFLCEDDGVYLEVCEADRNRDYGDYE